MVTAGQQGTCSPKTSDGSVSDHSSHLVHDVRPQIFGILARFLGDQPTVIVAIEQLEVALLGLDRLQRCLFAMGDEERRRHEQLLSCNQEGGVLTYLPQTE